ncbi:hypothetical protein [Prosthecobacter sp.]|uniref:hypothetical protein n=1 Tax=Prosthecobacter sp. TaxID=1965333 RepID=UPI003784190A
MTVESFALVLVAEMEADQSTALVDAILKAARKKLLQGNGTVGTLIQSGVNGKTFQRQVDLDCAQVIDACRRALKMYLNDGEDDDQVSATYPDFSGIIR